MILPSLQGVQQKSAGTSARPKDTLFSRNHRSDGYKMALKMEERLTLEEAVCLSSISASSVVNLRLRKMPLEGSEGQIRIVYCKF